MRNFITCYYDERKEDGTAGDCGMPLGRAGNGEAEGKCGG